MSTRRSSYGGAYGESGEGLEAPVCLEPIPVGRLQYVGVLETEEVTETVH